MASSEAAAVQHDGFQPVMQLYGPVHEMGKVKEIGKGNLLGLLLGASCSMPESDELDHEDVWPGGHAVAAGAIALEPATVVVALSVWHGFSIENLCAKERDEWCGFLPAYWQCGVRMINCSDSVAPRACYGSPAGQD